MAASKRILIVEDDFYILSALAELLTTEGYSVSTAHNGQEAIDFLRASDQLPDLILLDLMMPIKDGRAFRREQAADPSLAPIPVVVMTADCAADIAMLGPGLRDFLRKPIDIDHILHVVDRFSNASAA